MPRAPLKPCSYPGCPKFTNGTYCEKHRKAVNNTYNRYSRTDGIKKFYNSSAWRLLSKSQLQRQPLCEECLRSGRIKPAQIADHIISVKQDYSKRYDINNLQSLCKACHNKKTFTFKENNV